MKTFKTLPPAVRAERRAYAWFFGALLAVVALCTWGTAFNPFSLFAEGDAFWTFFSEDFWPPAIPERAGRLEAILSGIGVTLAMAIASATVAAILAFFMALFASERVSPFPRVAPLVRGLATFVRNIPALVWAFILFSSLGIGTGVGFVALTLSSPAFLLGAAVVAVGSLIYLDLPWAKLASRVPDLGDVFWKLGHLDFARWELILSATKETICVAVLSTFYGMLLGILFGMLAAENVLRVPFLAPAIKAAFTFLRAVPTPVWVLLMMVCVGMGPAAGIAGLCVHTTAFFTRAFAQSFEDIPAETLEALEATGVGRVGVFLNAVLPSALARVVAWVGMRLEINVAECAILGMVGAGGVGFVIANGIQNYEYGSAGVAILLVFVMAYFTERLFVFLKRRLR